MAALTELALTPGLTPASVVVALADLALTPDLTPASVEAGCSPQPEKSSAEELEAAEDVLDGVGNAVGDLAKGDVIGAAQDVVGGVAKGVGDAVGGVVKGVGKLFGL